MEKPFTGSATITDTFGGVEISIPAKKNWFLILFLGAWLGGWTMGEIFAGGAVVGMLFTFAPASFFILFWLCGWTVAGFFAWRTFIWMVLGKEVITFGQGEITLSKKGMLFAKAKTYSLDEAKNFRVDNNDGNNWRYWGWGKNNFSALTGGGIICFDYGMKTIRFAAGIDEPEAKFILQSLLEKRVLSEKHIPPAV